MKYMLVLFISFLSFSSLHSAPAMQLGANKYLVIKAKSRAGETQWLTLPIRRIAVVSLNKNLENFDVAQLEVDLEKFTKDPALQLQALTLIELFTVGGPVHEGNEQILDFFKESIKSLNFVVAMTRGSYSTELDNSDDYRFVLDIGDRSLRSYPQNDVDLDEQKDAVVLHYTNYTINSALKNNKLQRLAP